MFVVRVVTALARIAVRLTDPAEWRYRMRLFSFARRPRVPSARAESGSSVMLISAMPPATNFSGGLFLNEVLSSIDFAVCDAFIFVNRYLRPDIPEAAAARMNCRFKYKPVEQYHARHHRDTVRAREIKSEKFVESAALPALLDFAKLCRPSAFWIVVEGQSIIRLAHALIKHTDLPVHIQVMDPPQGWLRAHGLDDQTTSEVLKKFDFVLRHARSCAAASWAMAERYASQYGIRSVPVVPSLPAKVARPPRLLATSNELRIGFAGQIYAEKEWSELLAALELLKWQIGGRAVVIDAFVPKAREVEARHRSRIRFRPWGETEQLAPILAECDVLYCPYRFDESWREDAELCFPSKLATYLACGVPVLFHGPAYSSPAHFLSRWEAGFICTQPDADALSAALIKIFSDAQEYHRIATNGSRAFHACLTADSLTSSVHRFLDGDRVAESAPSGFGR